MSVTLEVFQLDMFASKVFMFLKRRLMLEMHETSQSAIRPCVATAEALMSVGGTASEVHGEYSMFNSIHSPRKSVNHDGYPT